MTLAEFIPIGNESRITSSEICRQLGISGAEVRKQINSLRANGVAIASDSKGYYMATEPSDLDHTIASFNSRIHKMIQAREGLKNAQKRINSRGEQ